MRLNGHPLRDVIDYQFHLQAGENEIEIVGPAGPLHLRFGWDEKSRTPLTFDEAVFDRIRTCRCNCVFCFVDQLPPGLRPSLYLKDDDFRLSFLYGNFITLGNLAEEDLKRIEAQRLSPLHVSVHATDPGVRARIMGCPEKNAARGLENLRRLGASGIETHIQIVLCPGINDGDVLERSVGELAAIPGVASVGVVPVAVDPQFAHSRRARRLDKPTDFGEPPQLKELSRDECKGIVEAVASWQRQFRQERGTGFVYAADEFYLRADAPLPSIKDYDGFPQYENGIGIAASFAAEAGEVIPAALAKEQIMSPVAYKRVFLLSGTLAARLVEQVCFGLSSGLEPEILPLVATNRLFGPHVTVTGLLGGRDIAAAAAAAALGGGDLLLIPARCLESSGRLFLDDLSLERLRAELPAGILVI